MCLDAPACVGSKVEEKTRAEEIGEPGEVARSELSEMSAEM